MSKPTPREKALDALKGVCLCGDCRRKYERAEHADATVDPEQGDPAPTA